MPMKPPRHAFPIPYQVEFHEENKGRHLDSTKRKLVWKFGFVHPPTIFPHLFDDDENYVGYREERADESRRVFGNKSGIECRGREHEVVLVWSLVSGKAHIYVDNRELYRNTPPTDEIFNPFTAQFHHGFNLPNSKFNGHHRIDIRCYARVPIGAKNMATDAYGGKFHQYDLSVDGLSFFSMPAMYELGTDKMWSRIQMWGMVREDSRASGDNCTSEDETDNEVRKNNQELKNAYTKSMTDTYNAWNEIHDAGNGNSEKKRTGRLVDEYHFDKAKQAQQKQMHQNSFDRRYHNRSISKDEYKAMNPQNEREAEKMMQLAMTASMRDLDKKLHNVSSSGIKIQRKTSDRKVKSENNTPRLAAVGEEENLIDFGEDNINDISRGVSQIAFSPAKQSDDVSVLGDDDMTTASFMMPMQQPRFGGLQQQHQQSFYPYQHHQRVQSGFHDPTFNQVPYTPSTPSSNTGGFNDAASFAMAPPPTWDDYKDAFGGSVRDMGASVMGGGASVMSNPMMSPMSASSPMGTASFVPQQYPQQQYQQQPYQQQQPQNGFSGNTYPSVNQQWQAQPFGTNSQPNPPPVATNASKHSMFDPLSNTDPFAS